MSKAKIFLGIDEVGRGPWAGPLVVGAVILGEPYTEWENLTDSKKLMPKRRQELNKIIRAQAAAYDLGWVPAAELDRYGLSNSLKLATRRAVKQILATKVPFDEIIIDGTVNFLQDTPLAERVTILKKADLLVKEVSAASIIAKVARDQYMIDLAKHYPEYGFDQHMGYGTALHRAALAKVGPCPEHRKSFRPVREIMKQFETQIVTEAVDQVPVETFEQEQIESVINTTAAGNKGEEVVAAYLRNLGHTIVARNYKTKTYEVDIISTAQDKLYFTEVKYRQQQNHGTALDQIDSHKLGRMQAAAESFVSSNPAYQNYQPLLAAGTVQGDNFTFGDWFVI